MKRFLPSPQLFLFFVFSFIPVQAAMECPVKFSVFQQATEEYFAISKEFDEITPKYLEGTTKAELIDFIKTGYSSPEFRRLHQGYCLSLEDKISSAVKVRKIAEQMMYLCKDDLRDIVNQMKKAESLKEFLQTHGCVSFS
tara:strand:- start:19 stop:438 length:420 start_codon:yes stop_codon:yes gene_type:complete